jgi:hypothetical protein
MNRSRLGRLTAPSIVVVAAFSLAACGGNSSTTSSTSSTTGASGSALPINVIVPLSVVHRYFPDITQQASTGPNASAIGKPTGTRQAIYSNSDGSKKVTLSVDQYASAANATSGYQQAVQGSQSAPGAKSAPPPTNLGQQAFAGTSQVGAEMHFGLGVLDGRLIVAATYAGFPVTPGNSANLVALTGMEDAVAKQVLGSSAS